MVNKAENIFKWLKLLIEYQAEIPGDIFINYIISYKAYLVECIL